MYVGLYAICVWNLNWKLTQDYVLIKHWSQRTHRCLPPVVGLRSIQLMTDEPRPRYRVLLLLGKSGAYAQEYALLEGSPKPKARNSFASSIDYIAVDIKNLLLCPKQGMSFWWPLLGSLSWCPLSHWGRVTHICVSRLTITASDNGLLPGRRQAIIWTNAGISLIGPLGTNYSENLIEILTFSFTKMRLKVSSAKWRPFCLGLNVLSQVTVTQLNMGHPWMKSTGAPSSNELQRLDYMTEDQDSNLSNGSSMTCPIVPSIW